MRVVDQLRGEVTLLSGDVAELRAELAAAKKNSSNSSKPPSSDIVKKPKDKPKDGSKRKRGGQRNHPRQERAPFPDDEVDYTELHCSVCPDCHGPVVPSKNPPKVFQQADLMLPTEMIAIVGVRSHSCWCRRCRQVHYAPIDSALLRAGLIGPRLTSLIAYLKGACHCSYSTIRKFIRDVLQITLSRGYLAKLIAKASASLREKELQSLLASPDGRTELHLLESRYHEASGKLRPANASVVTYILVHERGSGLISS